MWMCGIYIASVLHIFFACFVLWVVPVQYVFYADLVAFPVSLFALLRDIVSRWYTLALAENLRKASSVIDSASNSSDESDRTESSARASGTSKARKRNGNIKQTVSAIANAPSSNFQHPEQVTLIKNIINGESSRGCGIPFGKVFLLIVQIALFAMVLDFVYRPLIFPGENLFIFRPGFVSHDTAKLHIRYSDGGQYELRYKPLASAGSAAAGSVDWNSAANVPWESAGHFDPPTNATDYTVTVKLQNLKPSTKYAIELHSLESTLHAPSVLLGSVELTTAPVPGSPARLRFGTGSCIKPNFPYRPTTTPDVYGFASMLGHSDNLDMIMFMGDFIYADVPQYIGGETEDYRRLYRQVYMAPSTRSLLRKVPMLHVYDDHEIKNNWHLKDKPPMGSAMTAYNEYNGKPNPPTVAPDVAYFNFTHGNIAFYAWDTRRYRTLWETKEKAAGEHTMLGAEQKAHFFQWLRDVNQTAAVKFVVSSVPVTTGWSNHDSNQDTWRGYPTERTEILEMTKYVPNLYFLSGDRHEMAATKLASGNIEFSTSPISMFTFPIVGNFVKDSGGETTLHYRRPGRVKYGIIDVDTVSDPKIPKVTYSLYTTDVDDAQSPAWIYEAKGSRWN